MKLNIGIVGATGLVGERLLTLFDERNTNIKRLQLIASSSKHHRISFRGKEIPVESITGADFSDLDVVFLSAGSSASKTHAQRISDQGALVIDNSNAFRMEKDVPLVVPQINAHELIKRPSRGIVSNPNCSTIPIVRVLHALSELKPQSMVVSTYQAVSGSGNAGIEQLRSEQNNESVDSQSVFSHQIANNLIPWIDDIMNTGETVEELKMRQETRKILGQNEIKVSTSCVRVPVFNCHGATVCVDFGDSIDIERVRSLIENAEEMELHDTFPTPVNVSGSDYVHVGRVRVDPEFPNRLQCWVVSDNTRVGAALNAVQIMEHQVASNFNGQMRRSAA